MTNTILYLAVMLAGGLLFNRFAKLVSLPNVTGYLLAGLLLGRSALNIIPADASSALDPFVNIALGFIAFSIGGEFKISNIKQIGGKSIIITLFQALAAVAVIDVVLWLCGFDLPLALTLGAIGAATAPASTLMVVRQYKAKGPVTQTLLPVVAMDDAVGLFVFAISISLAEVMVEGGEMSARVMLFQPTLEILLSIGLGAAIGAAISVALRFYHSRDNFLAMSVMAVLLGVALADLWNLSSLLLCMSIGAIVSNLRKDSESILEGCDRWTAPLFMLFFVISGAELDVKAIPAVGLLGVLYMVARAVGKYSGTYVGALITKAPEHVKNYLGFMLLPQAGVAIGMAQVCASDLPKYASQINTVILCSTIIFALLGPIVTKYSLIKAGEIKIENKKKPSAAKT